jgi:hypothetical protein
MDMNTRHQLLHPLIVLGFFIFAPVLASAATYYIAPSGSNSNPGTQAAPFGTLQKAHDVANPGDTIYMRGGTYRFTAQTTFTRDGTSGNRINVFNFPGEHPVIDAINQPDGPDLTGIIVMDSASWWHIKGIELKNGPVNGILAQRASGNNILEQLHIHHLGRLASAGGTGTALIITGTGGNNLLLNNDVHDNEDQLSFGGGANGISVVTSGIGNVIRGNRAWCNSDDGIDMWNAAPALIENNWISYSGLGINCRSTGGNGVGFKLGGTCCNGGNGTENDGGHTLKNNVAWKNRGSEFNQNSGKLPMFLYNNTAWSNDGGTNYSSFDSSDTFRNNISFGSAGLSSGTFNSWNLSVTINSADFASMDDTCMRSPRQADGSLPNCSFLKLVAGSDLIDKGTNVGIPYTGSAPDLGAFEYGGASVSDTTPPSVSISAPASGATVAGAAVTISANASDNVGVSGVQFKLDGVNLGAEDTTSPYSVNWNSTTATNGSHTLTALARDAAGNVATSTGVGVTVNNASPPPPPPTTNKFVIGDRVQATASMNVRGAPGGTLLYTQPMDALGTVIAGPTQTPNGVIWWQIDYDSGTDGWSGEDNLVKYTPPAGLVAAYKFEEASGSTVVDASGKGNTGTISGASRITEGRFGKALYFDGVDDWVTVNDAASLDLTTGMTLEAWVYPTVDMTQWATVILKEQPGGALYELHANGDQSQPLTSVTVGGRHRVLSGGSWLLANQWTHLAATYDGTMQRLYVNGTQVAQRPQTGPIQVSSSPLRMGGNSIWGEFFQGRIDEVRVYNRALNATDIQTDMNRR